MSTPVPSAVELAPRFPVLDSLRAVGAVAVLTTHTAFQAGAFYGHGTWGTLLARLDVGVALFFVLSGFLLSRPHFARAVTGLAPPRAGRYLWKRFVRIYPVYLVAVLVALTVLPENDGLGVRSWISSLLMVDVYVEASLPQGLTQMWSLAAEVAFYALLPLLMTLAVGRRRVLNPARVLAVLSVLVAVSILWHLGVSDALTGVTSGVPGNWLSAHLSWFVVGIALAMLHVQAQAGRGEAPVIRSLLLLARQPGTCWALAGGLLLVAATPLAGPTMLYLPAASESLTKHVLYALIGGLVILTGVFPTEGGRYQRVMSFRALRRLGHISYSVFCIHLVVLYAAWAVTGYAYFEGHTAAIWVITLLGSLLAAELLYRFVEEPAMRWKNLRPPWSRGPAGRSSTSQPSTAETAITTR